MKMAECITSKEQATTVFRLLEVIGYGNGILLNANVVLPRLDAANYDDQRRIQALNDEIGQIQNRIKERTFEGDKTRAFIGLFEGLEVPERPREDEHAET
jgi:hypothetical protein